MITNVILVANDEAHYYKPRLLITIFSIFIFFVITIVVIEHDYVAYDLK